MSDWLGAVSKHEDNPTVLSGFEMVGLLFWAYSALSILPTLGTYTLAKLMTFL